MTSCEAFGFVGEDYFDVESFPNIRPSIAWCITCLTRACTPLPSSQVPVLSPCTMNHPKATDISNVIDREWANHHQNTIVWASLFLHMFLHIKAWVTEHLQHQSGMVHPSKKHLKWELSYLPELLFWKARMFDGWMTNCVWCLVPTISCQALVKLTFHYIHTPTCFHCTFIG